MGHALQTECSPSVSISNKFVSESRAIGLLQIQIPFVHGCVLGPIANPFILYGLGDIAIPLEDSVSEEGFAGSLRASDGEDGDLGSRRGWGYLLVGVGGEELDGLGVDVEVGEPVIPVDNGNEWYGLSLHMKIKDKIIIGDGNAGRERGGV